MALASPGVQVKEIDFTATVQVADQNIGVIAVDAQKGPTDVVTYLSSERELVDTFGSPNDYNFEAWFAAATIIQYGGIAAVIRPSGATDLGLRNSNIKRDDSTDSDLVIKNRDDFDNRTTNTFEWAARTAGAFNNGVTVHVVDHGADQEISFPDDVGSIVAIDNYANAGATASRTAGTYSIVATGGGGSGATFSVVIAGNGAATITMTDNGSGYADNDTLTLPKSNYGGATDITVQVNGALGALPVAGAAIKWASGTSTYYGSVYKVVDGDTIQVTLWDTTQRLVSGSVVQTHAGAAVGTVSAVNKASVYDTLEYATGKKWSTIVPQPGTSSVTSAQGGKYDEFHIAVVDTAGTVSGSVGEVLEVLSYISKATDAKTSEGTATYWKTYVREQSKYIYPGDQTFADTGDQLTQANITSGKTSTNISSASANAWFKPFSFGTGASASSTETRTLGAGADYDYSTSSKVAAVDAGLLAGYDLVKDPEIFGDIDFLVPGKISNVKAVGLIAISEARRDCITVCSPERSDVISSDSNSNKTDNVVDFFNKLPSTSYAIYDSGYKYIYDKYNDVYRYVPCAADTAGLCISATINAESWFSPAGYNRGQIRNATKLAYSPRQADRDRLYTARINPISTFPGQGIVLFGDKTALASPSAFDRINVRRLFIELEKNIAQFSKYQLFEINDELTRAGFRAAVEPYLRGVQGRRGIYDFLVVCDTSNNTPDVIDRNEFKAEIYIKPARSINFITITFVATRTGVSFNELIT
jgi:hypothetical protein